MDGLKDYIEWLGDVDFSAKPLNETDAVILCLISYYDLAPAASEQPEEPDRPFCLHDCLDAINAGKLELRITGGEDGNLGVFRAAANSRRFGSLAVTDYVDRFEPENDLQFSAVTFSYGSEWSFIAFRGTDNTIVGWKEDFKIAYTQTEAQKLAFAYTADAIFPDTMLEKAQKSRWQSFKKVFFRHSAPEKPDAARRWYIGGHSKGGNLAMFSACQLEGSLLEKVERIFNLDGPGFAPEVIDPSLFDRIEPKTVRIIPEYSIIGRLLESENCETHIIKSSNSGVMQHSIASWGVDHGHLAMSDLTEPKDRWLNDTIKQWVNGMSYEQRVVFIDELFGALEATGARTIDELASMGKGAAEIIMEKMKDFSEPTRKVIGDLQSAAVENALVKLISGTDTVIDTTKKILIDSTKKVISGLGTVAAEAAESIMVQIQLQKMGKGSE